MQIERAEVRVFSTVVEAGGFSRAAERLGITQSAVSQTIANLEHKLDAPLIVRGRTPELTEAGKRFFAYARTVINEERQALEEIEHIRTGALSTLSLAMNSTVNREFGSSLLLDFCERNPLIRLRLDVVPSPTIVDGVEQGRWELGFGTFYTDMPGHLQTRAYLREHRVLVAHKSHPNLNALLSSDSQAISEEVLLTSFMNDVPRRADVRLRDRFKAVWEISNLALQLELAQAGKGVTYVSDLLLDEIPEFVVLDGLDISRIPREVGIFHQKHQPLSEAAKRFIAGCDRHFA